MRWIRNFLHNINDIVLAIIIVALAAGIIYWRMQIILNYPKELADQQTEYQQEQADEADASEPEAGADDESADEDTDAVDGEEAGDENADEADGNQPQG